MLLTMSLASDEGDHFTANLTRCLPELPWVPYPSFLSENDIDRRSPLSMLFILLLIVGRVATRATGHIRGPPALEHDPEKWVPVFRKIMLKQKDRAG